MASKKVDVQSAPTPLSHNPFAALAGKTVGSGPAEAKPVPKKEPVWTDGKLVVRKENKGRGGKTVTVVQGIARPMRELFATVCKKGLGVGARVEDDDVVIQGEQVDRVISLLEDKGLKPIRGSG
jgi:translation initiation factor 1 (eIF-1/SUI1)